MKKLFVFTLIALFMAIGVCFAAGPSGPGTGDILGQTKYQYEAHKIFRLVHVSPGNNDSDGIAAGSVVVWDDVLDDGVSVETTTTSGDGRVAGIIINTVLSDDTTASTNKRASDDAGKTANWGWLQTYGLYESATANAAGTVTVGDSVCAGTTAGAISRYAITTAWATANSAQNGILGCALDTFTASGTGDIFITCD